MRQLRFVRPSDDGHLVVETADGNEQFHLPVDTALRDATRTDLPRAVSTSAGPSMREQELAISPRDIQMRVRSGESPQHLAEAYGVTLERIMRFAGAVMEERMRIAGESRRARARRSTTEGQVVVFGEAVDDRFHAHGISASDVTWDARRRDDGEWVVVAEWLGGDSRHAAEWAFHRTTRTVTPLDDTAADLLSDRPIRPLVPPAPEPPRLLAAPPLAPGIVAFPPMPDAHTGPLPKIDEVFDQEAPADGPRGVPPLVPAAAATLPTPVTPPAAERISAPAADPAINFDAPPLPLGITDASLRPVAGRVNGLTNLGVAKRDESDDDRASRARVPSWDDILLGVRRKQD